MSNPVQSHLEAERDPHFICVNVASDTFSACVQARDTAANIRYSRAIMQERGWRTAILVTEPHHIRRAEYIARDAGLTFTTSPVTDSPGWHTPPPAATTSCATPAPT